MYFSVFKEFFPSAKKKPTKFLFMWLWEAHHRHVCDLVIFLVVWLFPGRKEEQILLTNEQKKKSIIYHPTVRQSLQRTMKSLSEHISREEHSICCCLHGVQNTSTAHLKPQSPAWDSPPLPTCKFSPKNAGETPSTKGRIFPAKICLFK